MKSNTPPRRKKHVTDSHKWNLLPWISLEGTTVNKPSDSSGVTAGAIAIETAGVISGV